ncbi:MAG TPA: rRNA maturation RNase YbeY [Chitinophagaceae bacterium]
MKSSKPVIQFHFQSVCALPERRRLKNAIIDIFADNGVIINTLNIVFCSDAFLLDINREYLNHDYYTDIITFNLADTGAPIDGEVYISVDRVKENARTAGVVFNHELHRVIFHGVLHLCGYDDKTKAQRLVMVDNENQLLERYFVSRET